MESPRRSMQFCLSTVLLAFLLTTTPAAADDLLPDGDWIRVDAETFTIVANTGEDTALEMGRQVEQLRRFLDLFLGSGGPAYDRPLRMVLFRRQKHFLPYMPHHGDRTDRVGGWYVSTTQGDFMAVDASIEEAQLIVLFHELVHGWINSHLPGAPLWLQEGLAEVFSTFALHDGEAVVGRSIPWHVETLRENSSMSAEELKSVHPEHSDYWDQDRKSIYYAQSWALVHSLFTEDRSRFGSYLQRLRAGLEAEEAFQESFGAPLVAFMGGIDRYARQDRIRVFRVPMLASPAWENRTFRPLDEAEALVELGELLAALPSPRAGLAERHFQRALELDPRASAVHRGRAMLFHQQQRIAEAIAALEQAAALDPSDAAAHLHLGSLLVHRWLASGEGAGSNPESEPPQDLLRAAEHFRTALELRPDDPHAQAGLGFTAIASEDPAQGIAPLEQALVRLPWRIDLVAQLAVLQARAGNVAAARQKVDDRLRARATPDQVQWAELAIVDAVIRDFRPLIAENRLDEIETQLRDLRGWVRDPENIRSVQQSLDSFVEMKRESDRAHAAYEDVRAQYDRYNHAMELAREGRLAEARGIVAELAEQSADERLKKIAQEMLPRLDQQLTDQEALRGYDQALEMVRQDRLGDARRLLRDLLRTEGLHPKVEAKIRRFLDQLMDQ